MRAKMGEARLPDPKMSTAEPAPKYGSDAPELDRLPNLPAVRKSDGGSANVGAMQHRDFVLGDITDGLFVIDAGWRYVAFNEQASQVLGIDPDALIGVRVWDGFLNAKATKVWDGYHRAMETQQPTHFEELYPAPLSRWLECHCYPSPSELVVYFRDSTESHKADALAEQGRRDFEGFADAIPTLAWMADRDGSIYWYNKRWYEYTGTTPEQMKGWGWQTVHDPAVLPTVLQSWTNAIAAGKPVELQFPLKGADGVFRSFITRIVPILDAEGGVEKWVGTNTEIDELEKTRTALAIERARLAALIDNSPVGLVFADANGQILGGNKRAEELVRHPIFKSANIAAYDEWVSENADGTLAKAEDYPLARTLTDGKPYKSEYLYHRGDGTKGWVEFSSAPILNAQNEVTGGICATVDIDQRKRAQDTLVAAEKQLSLFVEQAPAAIAIFDRQMHYLAASHRYRKDYRIDLPVPGRSHYELFPYLPERWKEIHRRVLAGETMHNEEDTYIREDGAVEYLRWEMRPWFAGDGAIGGAILYSDIITKQCATEKKNEFLAQILEKSSQPFTTGYADGRLELFNPAFVELTGYTADELRSLDWDAVLTPVRWRKIEQAKLAEQQVHGRPIRYEKEYRRKDGSLVPVELLLHLVRNTEGGPDRYYAFLTDISDRLREAAEKRRNAERMTLGIEVASLGLAEVDYTTGIIHLSAEWARMYGLGEEAMTVPRALVLATFHPEDQAEGARRIAECQDPMGTGSLEMEHRILWPNGETRWLRVRQRVYFAGEGKARRPERAMLAAFDITESKKAQEALLRSEKLASVGRMASTIAHEINNPLETIGQSIYLAMQDTGIGEDSRRFLEVANQELERAALITRQTLSFNRDRSKPRLIDPVEVVNGVLRLLGGRVRSRQVALLERLRPTGEVMAFAGEMRQVLSNLLSNSLDAVENGGRIYVRTGVATGPDGRRLVRITVADTGSGIPPALLIKIFEPFFTTKDIVGTGLGLWISKQLVEKLGGKITVRSRKDTGTIFVLKYLLCAAQDNLIGEPLDAAGKAVEV